MNAVALAQLTPNVAVVLFTLGVFLVYVELNRPGSIVPGALGLFAALLSVAALLSHHLSFVGVLLLLFAVSLLLLGLLRPTPIFVSAAATLALVLGFRCLLSTSCCAPIALPVCFGCGTLLGLGTWYLTRVARRARANKGLD